MPSESKIAKGLHQIGIRMEKTFLNEQQIKLGARMVPFAGWEMPVQYAGIIEEHNTVRQKVGLFDVSHMGEVFVSGVDALQFLQKLVPQDVSKLIPGKAIYCQLTNEQGGIIDDLIIYLIGENEYLLIVNASRVDEDLNWIASNSCLYDVKIDNQSDNYSLLAIQGPKSAVLIEKMGLSEANQPEYFSIKRTNLKNIDVWVSRTGYTGEDGFEILVKNQFAQTLWDEILKDGKEFEIAPIGLGARDTLRLEVALHLYGNDLDKNTTPVEAGLRWSVAKEKQEEYNGKAVIMGQIAGTVPLRKKLIGFEMVDSAIARHGYEIYYEGKLIGKVTSGCPSPTLGKNIGLGYVELEEGSTFLNKTLGTTIQIMVRNKLYDALVVKLPFVQKKTVK